MDYLAALQDIAGNKYASDKTLEGIKYNADSNLAGTKYSSSNYGGSGYGSDSGSGSGTGASPTGTGPSAALADLDKQIAGANNTYTPAGATYTLSKNSDGTYGYTDSTGTYTLSAAEMEKMKNNDMNIKVITDPTQGSFTLDKTYHVEAQIPKNAADAESYYARTGKIPDGWTREAGANGEYWFNASPGTVNSPGYNVKSTFAGENGAQYSIGNGTGAQTWTYNSQTGLWSSSFGTTKNQSQFSTYIDQQNPMYVKKIK